MQTVTKNTTSVFFQYALPSVLGMLAISSATVVDGFFVGNYVGASAIAAVNFTMPIFALLFGLALMLGIGSSVVSGKLLAEGKYNLASEMFSKTLIIVTLLSLLMATIIYFSYDVVLTAFGAENNLHRDSATYILTFLPFIPFLMIGLVLDYFVKVDSRPGLAFGALFLSASVNVLLDWFLIVYLKQGLVGAAIATGISQLVLIVVLLPHFFSPAATIKFIKPKGSWSKCLKSASNGASEFVNEASVGITALIFNYIMLQSFGVDGVAAYAVVSYLIWFSIMVSFGISDSLQPLISKNFGAKRPDRIKDFIRNAIISVLVIGIILSAITISSPEVLADFFLESKDITTIEMVLNFAAVIWPLFIISGINLVISAYFTAIHKPLPSIIIALARSLLFPILFIYLLPHFFGSIGIYLALPIAELFTMFIAITLYYRLPPDKVIPLTKMEL
ncbi:MAG: MATE family efflux transporter [Colwellia sp.]|nr:MATE family efflux transporter [Colwellia sp.]